MNLRQAGKWGFDLGLEQPLSFLDAHSGARLKEEKAGQSRVLGVILQGTLIKSE